MILRASFLLLLLLLGVAVSTHAQSDKPASINIGDSAPQLRVHEWIKGTPVQRFEKGQVYVLEFWATWCKPCIASMPHLSILARDYKDKITVIGIDIYENKTTSIKKLKAFVDSMGNRMDFAVAAEDSNFMVTDWFDASGTRGIPRTFVINGTGELAWIGHPKDLAKVLNKIVDNTWNLEEALLKRTSDTHLAELDKEANYDLVRYWVDSFNPDFVPMPDSALLAISEIVKKEPKLKYAPMVAYNTFSALLITNPQKAYEYAKALMITPTYEDPAYSVIYDVVSLNFHNVNIPLDIYRLSAEACQVDIDQFPYPEIVNIPKYYHKMAWLYWLAKNKTKAVQTEQLAISTLESRDSFFPSELAIYKAHNEMYRICSVED